MSAPMVGTDRGRNNRKFRHQRDCSHNWYVLHDIHAPRFPLCPPHTVENHSYLTTVTVRPRALWLTLRRTNEPACPFGSFFSMLCLAARLGLRAESNTESVPPSPFLPAAFRLRGDAQVNRETTTAKKKEGKKISNGASLRWFTLQRADSSATLLLYLCLLWFPLDTG